MWYLLILPMALLPLFWCRRRPARGPPKYEQLYGLGTPFLSETPENRAARVVEEDTPAGKVRMRFREDTFEYWAKASVPYRYLETVARKYVIVYDCRENYINIFRELLNSMDPVAVPVDELLIHKPAPTAKFVKKRANVYRWMGKEEEISVIQPPLTYADYKKIC